MYKLIDGQNGVIREADGAYIPEAEGNRDWMEYQEWLAVPNTPTPADVVDPWVEVRAQRNSLLAQSDWTQLADSPLDAAAKTAWMTYRQELRDITLQADPAAITWPTEPA